MEYIKETTIPKEKWGVHEHHCCERHGCKYGHKDCPVSLGMVKQKYPCEICSDEEFEKDYLMNERGYRLGLIDDILKYHDRFTEEEKQKIIEMGEFFKNK